MLVSNGDARVMPRRLTAAPANEFVAELGEGPQWDGRSRTLSWVDLVQGRLGQATYAGFDVEIAFSADEAEAKFASRKPALSIVELMISGGVGRELCQRLKDRRAAPLAATTCRCWA